MSRRYALPAIVLGATLLRLYLWTAGPDLDTDAYGHAVLGRYTWDDPGNLQIHWVWLPLWHFFFGLCGALGLGFQFVRLFDIALSAVIPVLVFRTVLLARARKADESVAVLGAHCSPRSFPSRSRTASRASPRRCSPRARFSRLHSASNAAHGRAGPAWPARRGRACLRFEAWAAYCPAFAVASVLLEHLRAKRCSAKVGEADSRLVPREQGCGAAGGPRPASRSCCRASSS